MVNPSTVFSEIVSTTLRDHPNELKDNVSNNNALFNRLTRNNKFKERSDGGYEIARTIDYAENSTYQRYSGYEVLNVQASDVLTAVKYDWKQAAVHVAASGLELRQNSGEARILDFSVEKVRNAIRTFANNLSVDLYSDGTADGGKQIGGLQAVVSDAGTGTVGGINSTTFSFWQNIVQSAAAPLQGGGAITPGKGTIKQLMNPLWLELTRGMDKPDLIVASNNYFSFYEESLQDLQRYTKADDAKAGFDSLKYKSADVIFDGGSIPDNHMYFLNTNYLEFVAHKEANMTKLETKPSFNQDAVVIPIILMGNLVCTNRSLQGVLKA